MKQKKLRKMIKKIMSQVVMGVLLAVVSWGFMATPVFAAIDASGTLGSLNNFRDFLGQLISLIGTFYLLWGIFEFANSLMGGGDGIMQATAFKKIAAGFICMAAPDIYTLLKG